MENIIIQPPQQEYVDFMSLPMGVFKNIQYYNRIQGSSFVESGLCKKNGCMYYSHTIFKVKKSKNSFYRSNGAKHGFTLNEKGKLSIWYGKNIFEIPNIMSVFEKLNLNWLDAKLHPYITKTIAEKLLTGKLTNNLDVVRAYIKAMRLNCGPRLLFNMIKKHTFNKPYLLSLLSVAKDQNHLLEYFNSGTIESPHFMEDLVKQAAILDRKIDFTWSKKRLTDVHQQWTKEIMEIEVNDMKDVIAEHLTPLEQFKYPGFTLLKTKKEVYTEGKIMNHCVYTNYWSSVERKHYVIYRVEWNDQRATLGCYTTDSISYNQCYGYRNQSISVELQAHVTEFITKLNTWAKENNIIKQNFPDYELI